MRYQYVVILKKDSERATDLLSILLCLFSAFSFLRSAIDTFRSAFAQTLFLSLIAVALLAGLIINIVAHRKGKQVRFRYWLLLAAVGWIGMTTIPWVAAFFFLLAFLEFQSKRPLEIGFDRDRVVINSLIKKRYAWTDFNNVVLKDGLLTLDFRSNKLLQKEVADDDDEDDADEEEFNMYCQERLTAAKVPA